MEKENAKPNLVDRLEKIRTDKSFLEEERKAAVLKCENSQALNEFVKGVMAVAVNTWSSIDDVKKMTKEICSEFIVLTVLFPNISPEQILLKFCDNFMDITNKTNGNNALKDKLL